MFLVNQNTKEVSEIKEVNFSDFWLTERKDLQEWICNNPSILWEDLLIIQKEFNGFENTNERLDLLALDKNSNLVVIENKLDDSWSDVVWQAMKYAAYCSTLTTDQIKEIYQKYLNLNWNWSAEEKILEFLDEVNWTDILLNKWRNIRIILVAHNFRKEVLSTVYWAAQYDIKLQCIKIIPHELDWKFIIDVDQIFPEKDIQDLMIRYVEKSQNDEKIEEKKNKKNIEDQKFWHDFVKNFKENSGSKLLSWISEDQNFQGRCSFWAWKEGVNYRFYKNQNSISVQLRIMKNKDKEYNKKLFKQLFDHKDDINKTFWEELIRDEMPDNEMSKIYYEMKDIDTNSDENTETIYEFFKENMINLHKAINPYIK